ncbi:MAG: hypothetical protein GXP27_00215 [Planctomycetes bacterium]|nr:hypothetical protein [Planctomycetota bacterium]
MNRSWIPVVAAVVGSWIAAFLGAYWAVSVRMSRLGDPASRPVCPEPFSAHWNGGPLADVHEPQQSASGQASSEPRPTMPEPGRLPASVPATALKTRRDPSADAVRTVIEQEMPDASPDEVEVWAEELKGLGPEAAREILKLRNAMGRPWETSRGGTSTPPSSSSGPRPVRYVDLQ